MDTEKLEDFNNMSKVEILRGIVTERLAAAAQEILAVVERTVAGYEEEASGFRQEIDRQRRQLGALLLPRVQLTRIDDLEQLPPCEEEEEAAEGEAPDEEPNRQQPSVGDTKSLGFLSHVEEEKDEKEEDGSAEGPAQTSSQHPEHLKDADYQRPSRAQSEKRNRGRHRISETQNHLDLRVCMLEDFQTDVLSTNVQEVKCPRGLQEEDFLDLLRSRFPQLAGGNKAFDVFTTDRRRKLQPLKLKTLTPEEIRRSIKSIGAGKSALYIRLKVGQEQQASEEELHPLQGKVDATRDSPSTSATVMTSDQTKLHTSNSGAQAESSRADLLDHNSASQQQMETGTGDDRNDCGSSDPTNDSLAPSSHHSSSESEKDLNDVEDRDDDWTPAESELELHSTNKTRKRTVQRSSFRDEHKELIQSSSKSTTKKSNSVLSCKVCGALHRSSILIKHAWSHVDDPECLCGFCGERFESAEALRAHLQSHQKTLSCDVCGKSFLSMTGLNNHSVLHTGKTPHKCDICHKIFAVESRLISHQWVHVEDKPHKCDICHKTFGHKVQLDVHRKVHTAERSFHCSECGKSFSDLRSLSRHKLSHTGERRFGCEVCGKRFSRATYVQQHQKVHTVRDKTYLCDICCRMFYTSMQLKIHMERHTKEKPYCCSECGKCFSCNGDLAKHKKTHTGERPYSCSECGRSFRSKAQLTNHVKIHSGLKPFVCGVCGKACTRSYYLTVHMRTHSGEKPYQCTVCDKAFTQSHCLKTHMKSHQMEENASLDGSNV